MSKKDNKESKSNLSEVIAERKTFMLARKERVDLEEKLSEECGNLKKLEKKIGDYQKRLLLLKEYEHIEEFKELKKLLDFKKLEIDYEKVDIIDVIKDVVKLKDKEGKIFEIPFSSCVDVMPKRLCLFLRTKIS